MTSDHTCVKRDSIEILLVSYPNAIWRCETCGQVMKMIPFDDLPEDELDAVSDVLKRQKSWRKGHGGRYGKA